jgi:hypothetical protein
VEAAEEEEGCFGVDFVVKHPTKSKAIKGMRMVIFFMFDAMILMFQIIGNEILVPDYGKF